MTEATDAGRSPSVSVVITNYNTWRLTSRCVNELRGLSGERLAEIVVVDDGSPQSPPPAFPAKVITNPTNRGYVASVNIGVGASSGDVVVLLDSDARPLTDVVGPCIDAFGSEPLLGALGFSTVDERGNETGSSDLEPDVLGLLVGQRLDQLRGRMGRRSARRLLFSCAIAIRRAAFDAVNGFDEGFDFLDADLDFSARLHDAGWTQRQDPRLIAVHTGGGSPQATAIRVQRFHRNRWRYLAKHGKLRARPLLKSVLATRHAVEYCALRLIGPIVFPAAVLSDKLSGRRALLRGVSRAYGNE